MVTRRDLLIQASAATFTSSLPSMTLASSALHTADTVQTVRGKIRTSELGFTLPHEHLFTSSPGIWRAWPELLGGRKQFIEKATDKLKEAKDEGVDTIVDLTTADLGRDVRLAEEISRRSGVNIIACTGHWNYPALSMSARTTDELTEFFLREIEKGIEDTEIKAGVIKIATDKEGATPFIDKALRAAARASKMTGVPISTHTFAFPPTPSGKIQADIFESEGLDPSRVSIGHSDDSINLDYLKDLAERGFTVGMDHLTRGIEPPWQPVQPEARPYLWHNKTKLIKTMIEEGYTNKLFLSNDWFFADSAFGTGTLEIMEKLNPDGILFVTRKVIPLLKELGATEDDIRAITIDNPRRFFAKRQA